MQSHPKASDTPITEVDDPKAKDFLRRAFNKTYRWPAGFSGFSADLVVEEAGRRARGAVEVRSSRDVRVTLDDESFAKWAEGQISMMAVHRGPRTFEESDGKHVLTFGEDDGHPLGRTIRIHGDGMGSFYRVMDDRIRQINRRMERIAFTINVDDSLVTEDNRHLTTRYVVYYYSPADRRLNNVDSFLDQHAVVSGVYLPGVRLLSFSEGGDTVVRRMQFSHHKLV